MNRVLRKPDGKRHNDFAVVAFSSLVGTFSLQLLEMLQSRTLQLHLVGWLLASKVRAYVGDAV